MVIITIACLASTFQTCLDVFCLKYHPIHEQHVQLFIFVFKFCLWNPIYIYECFQFDMIWDSTNNLIGSRCLCFCGMLCLAVFAGSHVCPVSHWDPAYCLPAVAALPLGRNRSPGSVHAHHLLFHFHCWNIPYQTQRFHLLFLSSVTYFSTSYHDLVAYSSLLSWSRACRETCLDLFSETGW